MNREADALDQAAELTQQLNEAYISNARDRARPEQQQNADGSWPRTDCECGDPIPAPRLALGKIRCISCQEDYERGVR